MPQFARPSADTNNPGNWTTQSGGTTNLYTTIDEATADDTDYIQSPTNPADAVYVTKLSSVVNPGSTSNHIIRYRASASQDNQQAVRVTIQLRQGYVSEANQGTLIASHNTGLMTSTTWTTYTYTLSAAEAGSITNYADLYYRIIAGTT